MTENMEIEIADRAKLLAPASYPADRNPARVYIASLPSQASRRTMEWALSVVSGMFSDGLDPYDFPWARLRYQHVAAIRAKLIDDHTPPTARTILAGLRGALKHAWRLGLISRDDYARAVDLDPIKGVSLPKGRNLTQGEVHAMMGACEGDSSPAGPRDAAMIALMYSCGLRRTSLASLQFTDYNPEADLLTVRRTKGRKDIEVFITDGAEDALADWIEIRGDEPGPLFLEIGKGGKVVREQRAMKRGNREITVDPGLTSQAVYNMVRKRSEQAEIKGTISPHDFRRTFATDLLDRDVDVLMVAELGGWSSPDIVKRYDRRGDEAKRKAIKTLHVPYKRRFGDLEE